MGLNSIWIYHFYGNITQLFIPDRHFVLVGVYFAW